MKFSRSANPSDCSFGWDDAIKIANRSLLRRDDAVKIANRSLQRVNDKLKITSRQILRFAQDDVPWREEIKSGAALLKKCQWCAAPLFSFFRHYHVIPTKEGSAGN